MLQVVTSFKVAHGKGQEAIDFVKETVEHVNKNSPKILESKVLRSSIGQINMLFVVSKINSYADWEETQQSSGSLGGFMGAWGKDFIVPDSLVRHIYEEIE
jgi:hypothetical protein